MPDEPKMPIPELGDAVVESGGDTLYQCMQCGLCVTSCPWRLVEGEISEEFNTRKLQHMGQLGVEGYESRQYPVCLYDLRYLQDPLPPRSQPHREHPRPAFDARG